MKARSLPAKRVTSSLFSRFSPCARRSVSYFPKRNFTYSSQIGSTSSRGRRFSYFLFGSAATCLGIGYAFYDHYLHAEDDKTSATTGTAAEEPKEVEHTAKPTPRKPEENREYKYVLIGGGTASYSALKEIKRLDPEATVC